MKAAEREKEARRRHEHARRAREKNHVLGLEETVDTAGQDSFPASNPPSWSATHLGTPIPVRREPEMFHDVVQRIRDDVRLLSETLGERNDRSSRALQNLARAADAIADRLRDAGVPVRRRAIDDGVWNVEAVLRGARLASETVVVGAHYDTPRGSPGADDNASGVAMLHRPRALAPGASSRAYGEAGGIRCRGASTWRDGDGREQALPPRSPPRRPAGDGDDERRGRGRARERASVALPARPLAEVGSRDRR